MPSAVLRWEVSSVAAKLLSISLAEPRVSLALASRDSVSHFGLARYMGSGFGAGHDWGGRGEVMVEGAFGGFVEFFGIEGFVGGCEVGFWRVGCWFDHGEAPSYSRGAFTSLPNEGWRPRGLVDR
jgi:hypothetical protein